MTPQELRAWMLLQPRPAYLQITAGDQSTHKLEITNGMHWISAAESCLALKPELIECHAIDGKLLRALRPAEIDKEAEEEDGESIEVTDPESQRVVIFSRLIAEAYKHSTEIAFAKMVEVFEISVRRQESLENSLEMAQKLLTKVAAEQISQQVDGAAAGGGGTVLEQIVAAFLQGQGAGAAQKSNAVNGAKPTPEGEP